MVYRREDATFIKRVIGIEGDTIHGDGESLLLNGRILHEPYVSAFQGTLSRDQEPFSAIVVPAGRVFILGDNRENSFDSRYHGSIPVGDLRGKPLYVYWSHWRGRIGKKLE